MKEEIRNIQDWKTMLQLEKLYITGETNANKDNVYFKYLAEHNRIDATTYKSRIVVTGKYSAFYETKIKEEFSQISNFLNKNKIMELATNFLISDIESLMTIAHRKEQIINDKKTRRQISSKFFSNGDAKYVKNNLEKAIKQILDIKEFPEESKDLQYLSILHSSEKPEQILLCENEDRLINPRQKYTEIWFAGGKNISKLKYVPKNDLPIFYLCDWDYDGLKTYLTIKKEYFNNIKLIIPENYTKKDIEKTNHKSKWKQDFDILKFNKKEQEIISELIPNYWIEEESIDIHELI